MCNPALTGYLVDLMVDFTHVDRYAAIRSARGKRIDQIAAILAAMSDESLADPAARDRAMYRHIGDYTLFWAGIYPEQLHRTHRAASDVLLDFVSQGKRSYAICSELGTESDRFPPSLFRNLSDDFESCLYGLGLVRRGLEERPADGSGGGCGLVY